MGQIVDGLLYTKDDEWIKVEGLVAIVGITDYAQDALSDIVFVELPEVGETFEAEETFGTVESVKAVADLLMPVDGEVVEANTDLEDAPESLNDTPYDSWIVKVAMVDPSQVEGMMDAAAYKAYCDAR